MFTPDMLESIKKVEATRAQRMSTEPRRMTAEEKSELLKAYHPDYRAEGFKEIKIGPNKGQKAPVELTDLLHSNSRLLNENIDLSKIDYDVDVLVIGGGGAGCSAAIEANEAGASVMVVTKLRIGDANTMMAEGGIQAADKPNDSPVQHYLDAFGGGHFAAKRELLSKLVCDAPDAILWLSKLGVEFDKDKDGTMVTTHGGGTSRKRMHACKDYSGAEIMRTLRDEVFNRPDQITVVDFTAAIEIIKDDKGNAAGAVLMNMETKELMAFLKRKSHLTTEDLFTGILHNRLGRVVTQSAGIKSGRRISELRDDELEQAVHTAKALEITLTETMGMDAAQVTAGGIVTSEFDPQTLESRRVPGLYACGEVLDIDGDCGGYNLQWAWSSGRCAGSHAGKER